MNEMKHIYKLLLRNPLKITDIFIFYFYLFFLADDQSLEYEFVGFLF